MREGKYDTVREMLLKYLPAIGTRRGTVL